MAKFQTHLQLVAIDSKHHRSSNPNLNSNSRQQPLKTGLNNSSSSVPLF